MNLRGLDLNLLPVFEAVFTEGGITRAAERLNLTQPAVSNALARLRAAFDDQLFVRSADGMAPTPAAKAIIGTKLDAAALEKLGQAASAACSPIDDKRGTIEFRTKVAAVLAKRAAQIAYKRAGGK